VSSWNTVVGSIPGLISRYKLDETAGTTVADSGPGANAGTRLNGTVNQPGLFAGSGTSYLFDNTPGSGSVVTAPHAANITFSGDFSIGFSFKSSFSGAVQTIVVKYSRTTFAGWGTRLNAAGKLGFLINDTTWFDSAASYNDGVAHVAVCTRSGTTVKIYVDGVLADTGTRTANLANTDYLSIGCDVSSGAGLNFVGTLDDVWMAAGAVDAATVAAIWAARNVEVDYMALVPSGRNDIPDNDRWGSGFGTTLVIDASGEKAAAILTVPENGSITHVGIRVHAVTTPQTLRVSLQTFDAATGDPTGTLYGGSTAGTQAAPAALTSYRVALGTPATAVKGNRVAVVVEFDATVGNVTLASVTQLTIFSYPYLDLFTGSWTKAAGWPCVYLDYGGTVYDCGTAPYSGITQTTINSGSTPDEYAAKIVVPFPCRVVGFKSLGTPATTSADCDYVLYDSGSTAIASRSFSAKCVPVVSGTRVVSDFFDAPVNLAAGATVRLGIRPSTAGNVNVTYFDMPTATAMDAIPMGQGASFSSRADLGAWTDIATRRLAAALLIDQLDDGTGLGGTQAPLSRIFTGY